MSIEFDRYAMEYSNLLEDPVRDLFASDAIFFYRRKWMLIRDFFSKQQVDCSRWNWLDVGCGQGDLLRLAGSAFAKAVGCDPSAGMIQSCGPAQVFCIIEHNAWNPVTQLIVNRCPVDSDANLLTASRAAKLACAMDLKIVETDYFPYFPANVFRRIGRLEQVLRKVPLGGQFAMFCRKSETRIG